MVFMRRCFLVLLASSLLFISACGKAPDVTTTQKGLQKQIVLWHWLTDREEVLNELAARYNKLTGVKVSCRLYAPSDAYSQKVMAAGQAKALPDVYGILGEKRIFAAFVNAGHIADLTSYMEYNDSEWEKSFFKKALEVNEFLAGNEYGVKPGIYGVPIDVMNIQLLYNKKLFRQAGINPNIPLTTWEEFIAVLEQLKHSGIKGLVGGWGETWMIDCFAHNYAFNIMGEEKVVDTIKGKVLYNDPDWVAVFRLFDELARKQLLVSGIVTMGNKTAEQLFANEKCAFAFNGFWCVNVYEDMNPDLEYAAMLPPRVSDKYPMVIWGGAGSSFMVNDNSRSKEEAINFLKWLTQKAQQTFLSKQTRSLPSNKDSLEYISPILTQFADDMDVVSHPNILPVQENPKVLEALTKGIQAIIIGVKTPEEIANEVCTIKAKVMNE